MPEKTLLYSLLFCASIYLILVIIYCTYMIRKWRKQKTPLHISLGHKIPSYTASKKNQAKKQIQELLREHEYNEDVIETIDNNFCQGFEAARDIILEILKTQYWNE